MEGRISIYLGSLVFALLMNACSIQDLFNSKQQPNVLDEKLNPSINPKPDIRLLNRDLEEPANSFGDPAAGKRVRLTLTSYSSTEVYHLLYLPSNWEVGKKYPVIVEYPGNGPWSSKTGDVSTGKVEGCNLGYGISGGKDFIWISMPFISKDKRQNQDWWWGDIEATKQYCKATIKQICRDYGGNENKLILAGFSRGAIATNYIGLHDTDIAQLWAGFISNSHYDGLKEWDYPDSDKAAAKIRLQRLNGRPQLICQEAQGTASTKQYIEDSGIDGNFSFLDIPYINHTNTWVLYDIPERQIIREWLKAVIEDKI